MKLLIIRHGQSEADVMDVHEGRADFELTPLGHRQAEAMARRVSAEYDVRRIYTSTLRRARQTAAHLEALTGVKATEDADLLEFNNGLLAGLNREEVAAKYPKVGSLPLHAAVYGQESALEFRFRAERALSRILSENPDETDVAVFTHGGMINQLYRAFLRLAVDSDVVWATGDTGIHEWHARPGLRRVRMANSLEHIGGLE